MVDVDRWCTFSKNWSGSHVAGKGYANAGSVFEMFFCIWVVYSYVIKPALHCHPYYVHSLLGRCMPLTLSTFFACLWRVHVVD